METRYTTDMLAVIATDVLKTLGTAERAVIGLSGDLGAGKTTLTQEIARQLGVQTTVVSPTFVIAKFYPVHNPQFDTLVHIDAYRIEDGAELGPLGWETIIATPRTLVIVEWPERIDQYLPEGTKRFHISHDGEARRITTV